MNKSARPVLVLILLILAILLSYIDRGSLSVAEPEVSAEFQLDPVQMGWLFSAFFWSYALFQIAAGWLVDRYDVKWVFAGGILLWSLATLSTGFVTTFAVFIGMRFLLGLGESVAYPAISRILIANFSETRRGLANALIAAGSKTGPAISMLVGGLIVARWGWRPLFIGMGLLSVLWLLPWLLFVPPVKQKSQPGENVSQGVGFGELLKRREVWGTSLGFFCLGYVLTFLISWLPAYLEKERGFSKEAMASYGSIPFWSMAVATILGGFFADRLIAGGRNPLKVRRTFLVVGFSSCAFFLFVSRFAPNDVSCLVLLTCACVSLAVYSSNSWAFTQTLAGPHAAGKWSGIQNAIGNMGGVVSPVLTGWIVKETGSYLQAFTAAGIVSASGVLIYLTFVPRNTPLEWNLDEQPDGHL